MNKSDKIFVAGHRGLVGSAILRALKARGFSNVVIRPRDELDLTNRAAVELFFSLEQPSVVIDAAAKVGRIHANNAYPADFIRDNLFIQNNLIDCAYRSGCKKFVFLGSTCIYPKMAPQPLKEEYLLTGPLEPSNEWYAIAKIAGIKMCQAYSKQYGFDAISLMPTNLYGPGDNFNLENSHVLPALLRKFHEAKINDDPEVTVWGTGTPKREFLHVDDLADAVLFLAEHYQDSEIINVGVGDDISIGDLAQQIKDVVGFEGSIVYDRAKPDGTPRKLLDVSRVNGLGWHAKMLLKEGIKSTYEWFLENEGLFRS